MGVAETAALSGRGVGVFDPSSTLVSPAAVLEAGVVLWPGVVVQVLADESVRVSAGAVLLPGTRIVAAGGCRVTVGEAAEIGDEGDFTISADIPGSVITVGGDARLSGGGSLSRSNAIEAGAQVLGPIRVQDCRLGGGGSHREPDPDLRGGVLKGCGVARGLDVPRGHVVQAFGLFHEAPLRRQVEFHPRPGG